MSGNEKKELGDYQTPLEFCARVCGYVKRHVFEAPSAVLEPTCGIGNFLLAASRTFDCENLYGIEINRAYARQAREAVPSAKLTVSNIFDVDTRRIMWGDRALIIGNPPWATNANLIYNLPRKANFKGLRGIDALTGASNFDICEYILLKLLAEYKHTDSTICMLCKTSVARNVLLELSRNRIPYEKAEILTFNSREVFGVSAAACVFVVKLSAANTPDTRILCTVKNFDGLELEDTLFVEDGKIQTSRAAVDLEGRCQMTWRQGVKHDCGGVMELESCENGFRNKRNEVVEIEKALVFPLVKSSHLKQPVIQNFKKYVIVTQTEPRQDTSYIQTEYPLTWKYLNAHLEDFNRRKSVIYKKSAPFAMFGIGAYSFTPYKVALSGFYKKPLFSLLYASKPIMTDDTVYYLAFEDYDLAYSMMLLLNSDTVQSFLQSIAFLDNKRPYTVKLLSRMDLSKCIGAVSFHELQRVEQALKLPKRITSQQYIKFEQYIKSLQSPPRTATRTGAQPARTD